MKKILLLAIGILLFSSSCSNKEIKLPTVKAKGVQELHNHSAVWMFYKIKNNTPQVKLNRNNTISSTHWVYNIDKRLPLKLLAENLKKLKHKHANSMHSKEGMLDYFSYSDTSENKLSFIDFSDVEFKLKKEHSKKYVQTYADTYKKYHNIHLTFNKNKIEVNTVNTIFSDLETTLTKMFKELSDKKIVLHLNFNETILYQDYITYFTFLHKLNNPNVNVSKYQFIFNCKKVSDYYCN